MFAYVKYAHFDWPGLQRLHASRLDTGIFLAQMQGLSKARQTRIRTPTCLIFSERHLMSIKFEIQPLFATPYMRADVGHAISAEQVKFIQNLPMVQNRANMISEDLYIFNRPELKSIADAVQNALNIYARDVMGISQTIYVTQSWALLNQPGVGMHSHAHSNSLISGSLYYCDLPEPVSRVVFDKHTAYQQLEIRPDNDRRNLYNTAVNVVTPKQGEVLLFPSSINHMIENNGSQDLRRAIAFNTFIKGKFGDYRDVSELHLA